MHTLLFAKRTTKEIVRDPITVIFGLGFPIVVLLLLSAIQANVPVAIFKIDTLAPGIAVFGLSFITLFSGTLIAKDRTSSLLQRLYTTPLLAKDYILGYMLPLFPIALLQSAICYIVAIFLGLKVTITIVYAILLTLPASLFFIALGLLCGTLCNDKQVGGLCGGLLTNVSAWLSGTWFDVALVGGVFQIIAYALPFVHAVELQRAVLMANYSAIFSHLWWVLGYALCFTVLAIYTFLYKMEKN